MYKPDLVSILITAWKEPATIGKSIETFVDGYTGEYELLLAIPDKETIEAAKSKVQQMGISDKVWFSDFAADGKPKGKPAELNYLMDKARGDIWFCGDGDVYYAPGVIEQMLPMFDDPQVMAVTGRPRSSDPKNTMMEYFGHLLADAAHHKRMIDLTDNAVGVGSKFVKKRPFFPVSGYLFAIRRTDVRSPNDTLVEDAYQSYVIHNKGGRIAYAPAAEVFVSYPKTLADYFKQKKRSVGGYVQLWKYGVVTKETNTRSFARELEYFWFPIRYASNIREFLWSLCLYPIRLWLWVKIFWERRVRQKDFAQTWVRVDSTK